MKRSITYLCWSPVECYHCQRLPLKQSSERAMLGQMNKSMTVEFWTKIFQKGLPFRVWVNGYWDFLSWGIFQRAECDKEQPKACDPEGHIVRVEDIQSGNEMSKMTSPQLPDWWMPDALYWWFWNLNMTQWEKWQQLSPWPNFSQFPLSILFNSASTWTVKTVDA